MQLYFLPLTCLFLLKLSSLNTLALINPPQSFHDIHLQTAQSSCLGTIYPKLCISTLAKFPNLHTKSLPQIIATSVNHTMVDVKSTTTNISTIRHKISNLEPRDKLALQDCLVLLNYTVSELNNAITDLTLSKSPSKHFFDLETLLSGAMTNQYTCLDGFAYSETNVRKYIEESIMDISHQVMIICL